MSLVTDDIWNDQSLTLDSDLPPGWRTIRDSSGTYYWHVPSGTTQWQHPSYSTEDEQSISNGLPDNQLKVSAYSQVTLLQTNETVPSLHTQEHAHVPVCKDGTVSTTVYKPHKIHAYTFPNMCMCGDDVYCIFSVRVLEQI